MGGLSGPVRKGMILMNDESNERMVERCKILEKMIRKEFPDDVIEVEPREPKGDEGDRWVESWINRWWISVEKSHKQNKPRVYFKVIEELMTDVDNGYEEIFRTGLECAKRILESDKIYGTQGVINLDNSGEGKSGVEFIPKDNEYKS